VVAGALSSLGQKGMVSVAHVPGGEGRLLEKNVDKIGDVLAAGRGRYWESAWPETQNGFLRLAREEGEKLGKKGRVL